MSDRHRSTDPIRDPLAGTWAEALLTPAEADVVRRRFGVAVDDGPEPGGPRSAPPEEGGSSGGGTPAPAAPPARDRRCAPTVPQPSIA